MRKPTLYEFNGKKMSIKEWALELNISVTTIQTRLNKGLPYSEVFCKCRTRTHLPYIEFNGETKSINMWASELGISYQVIKRRMEEGLPPEEILKTNEPELYKIQGNMKTLKELAEKYKILPRILRNRLKRGMSMEQALSYNSFMNKSVYAFGQIKTLAEWGSENNLSYQTLYSRYRSGARGEILVSSIKKPVDYEVTYDGRTQTLTQWSKELGIPVNVLISRYQKHKRGKFLFAPIYKQPVVETYTYNGITKSIGEWAIELGLTENGFRNRLRKGLTGEKLMSSRHGNIKSKNIITLADGTEVTADSLATRLKIHPNIIRQEIKEGLTGQEILEKHINKNKQYTLNGVSKSLTEWAEEYNLKVPTLYNRIRRGMTLEEALSIPPINTITYEGKTLTISQWSKETGINAPLLRTRLARGLTPPELFEKPKRKWTPSKVQIYKAAESTEVK